MVKVKSYIKRGQVVPPRGEKKFPKMQEHPIGGFDPEVDVSNEQKLHKFIYKQLDKGERTNDIAKFIGKKLEMEFEDAYDLVQDLRSASGEYDEEEDEDD